MSDLEMPPSLRRGGRSRILTRDAIAQGAFDLVDSVGPNGLTINRLAGHLGVGRMTLYGYADSKEEIVNMLADVLLADLPAVPRDNHWYEAVESAFGALHHRLVAHPHVTEMVVSSSVFGVQQAGFLENILSILTRAGFSGAMALSLYRTLSTYTIGFALLQISESGSPSSRLAWIQELSPADFPVLDAHAPMLQTPIDSTQFRRGLLRILAGFAPAVLNLKSDDHS